MRKRLNVNASKKKAGCKILSLKATLKNTCAEEKKVKVVLSTTWGIFNVIFHPLYIYFFTFSQMKQALSPLYLFLLIINVTQAL